jgi:hypothetical protein
MENIKKNQVTIDNVSYEYDSLTQEQQMLFNHCVDLDRKISSAQFNIDQLMVGKEAFINRLKASLQPAEQPAEPTVQ